MLTTKSLAEHSIDLGAIQKQPELDALVYYLWNNDPKVVVEIGTARGGLFWLLCQLAADNATLISVDLVGGKYGPVDLCWASREKLEGYGRRLQKIKVLRADSHSPNTHSRLVGMLRGQEIDLLVIDGDHSFWGVKQDWNMYSPLVRDGGLIVFHDIVPHDRRDCQVDRLWVELKKHYDYIEFIDEEGGPWGGIGVIRT